MSRFIPKTSFYDLHREFYLRDPVKLHDDITSMMRDMCSSLKLRLLLAKNNPDPFKHMPLNLDGHDTRVSHIGADKPSLYSYKLKKSGFRIQVCSDMNNIILFASKPAPCRDFNDGVMLVKMNIASHIHKLDCIALDGGYSGFVRQIVEPSDALSYENFSYPVHNTRGMAMADQELHYNKVFDTADETMAETAQEGYEVARILDHRGEGEDMEFLVQWEGFDISEATWVALQHSNYKQCIQDYWKTKISF
ncbi:hypothetical protein BX616_010250 [Lobosporangium transversale]|nr:hypothetical protein BX616_010250 [Lobosporangium transversale]